MEKHIPYSKLSKKKQRELNANRRGTWGGINPVTRRPPNPKAYNRQKARNLSRQGNGNVPSVFCDSPHPALYKVTKCSPPVKGE